MPVSTSSSDSRLPTTAVSTASSTAVAAREASAGFMGLGWVICPFLVTDGRGGVSASRRLYVTQLACGRSEEDTSELQPRFELVCRLRLEKKNANVKL